MAVQILQTDAAHELIDYINKNNTVVSAPFAFYANQRAGYPLNSLISRD
jgi:hypothetical protein